jgi:hypothetical protein
MEWLSFGALGILWIGFLLPHGGRRASPAVSVGEFTRRMDLLEQTEHHSPGRWLVAPKKGEGFMGMHERARFRARARRKRVFMALLEAIGVTVLIGLFPPLRGMWWMTLVLVLMLVAYCALLVRYRDMDKAAQERHARRPQPESRSLVVDVPLGPAAPPTKTQLDTDPKLQLGMLGERDKVHVTVWNSDELDMASLRASGAFDPDPDDVFEDVVG